LTKVAFFLRLLVARKQCIDMVSRLYVVLHDLWGLFLFVTWLSHFTEIWQGEWCYSLVFWTIPFHAILMIWKWQFDISIYHFFRLIIMIVTITEFPRENYWATITIISYSMIFDMYIVIKMISRYYHSIVSKILLKYHNIHYQTNDNFYQDILINCNPAA